jgi:hypothetical protein
MARPGIGHKISDNHFQSPTKVYEKKSYLAVLVGISAALLHLINKIIKNSRLPTSSEDHPHNNKYH